MSAKEVKYRRQHTHGGLSRYPSRHDSLVGFDTTTSTWLLVNCSETDRETYRILHYYCLILSCSYYSSSFIACLRDINAAVNSLSTEYIIYTYEGSVLAHLQIIFRVKKTRNYTK